MSIHDAIQKRRLAVITYQYDTATEDVMDYAGTNSITPPKPSRVIALDQFIKGLKRFGVWAKLDVLSNFAYNDTNADEFALIDLIRISEMTSNGGMTYTAEGYEGNGIDGYIDTQYNPTANGVNYTLNDAGFGLVLFKERTTGNAVISQETGFINLINNISSATQRINRSGNLASAINFSGDGLLFLNREDSTTVSGITRTTYNQKSGEPAANDISNVKFWLLRTGSTYSDAGIACNMFGAHLTYAETQTFRALYNEYLKQIGLTQFA